MRKTDWNDLNRWKCTLFLYADSAEAGGRKDLADQFKHLAKTLELEQKKLQESER